MKGYLTFLVLNELSKQELTGYDLSKQIEKKTGCWKPSYGSMYPLLNQLLKEKAVTMHVDKRKKLYALTERGKLKLHDAKKEKDMLISQLIEDIHVFETLFPKHYFLHAVDALEDLKRGTIPLSDIQTEIMALKHTIMELHAKKRIPQHKNHIKNILQKADKELRHYL